MVQQLIDKLKEMNKMTIVIGRKAGKKLPDEVVGRLTTKETNYWNDYIFTEENCTSYNTLTNKEERARFVQNVIQTLFGSAVTCKKYCEDKQDLVTMDHDEIVMYLRKKFEQRKFQQKNKPTMQIVSKIKSEIKPSNETKVSSKNVTTIPLIEDLYPKIEYDPSVVNDRFYQYSCIHTLFESFNFILYNNVVFPLLDNP